jgi:isoquinoline 1-oxidoreductase subunit alpha
LVYRGFLAKIGMSVHSFMYFLSERNPSFCSLWSYCAKRRRINAQTPRERQGIHNQCGPGHPSALGFEGACGIGECGACTVHIDGKAVASCSLAAGEASDREITTIEGLTGRQADALFKAWVEGDVGQCGYCQPGQIMQAAALLSAKPKPSEREIEQAMSKVLCRCGTYQNIRLAVQKAAEEI